MLYIVDKKNKPRHRTNSKTRQHSLCPTHVYWPFPPSTSPLSHLAPPGPARRRASAKLGPDDCASVNLRRICSHLLMRPSAPTAKRLLPPCIVPSPSRSPRRSTCWRSCCGSDKKKSKRGERVVVLTTVRQDLHNGGGLPRSRTSETTLTQMMMNMLLMRARRHEKYETMFYQ